MISKRPLVIFSCGPEGAAPAGDVLDFPRGDDDGVMTMESRTLKGVCVGSGSG